MSSTGNSNPTVSISTPVNNTAYKEGQNITIEVSASDLDGTIAKVEFYDGDVKIGEDTTEPYSLIWSGASVGNHILSAKAIDNNGAIGISSNVNVSVQTVKICSETSTVAQQGNFSLGYKSNFETVGNDVIVTFELLDTDRVGVVAYLWKESPFGESQMNQVNGNVFTKTLTGQTPGTTIKYACKFAFAGGLAVTRYVSYVVGTSCNLSVNDNELKENFSVYPNPTDNSWNFDSKNTNIMTVEVFDVLGKKVISVHPNSLHFKIDASSLKSGFYLARSATTNGSSSLKLIKK